MLGGQFDESGLLLDLAENLNLSVEKIDLVKPEELPLKVLAQALNRGIIILSKDKCFLKSLIEKASLEYPEVMDLYRLNVRYLLNPLNEIDRIRLLDLLNNAVARARSLEKLLREHSKEDFESSEVLDSALRWCIYEIVQSMIDACAVLVSCLKLGVAESYKDYIVALIKGNMMSGEMGKELADFILLRNRLAYRYRHVKVEELIEGAKKLTSKTLPAFQGWLLKSAGLGGRQGY